MPPEFRDEHTMLSRRLQRGLSLTVAPYLLLAGLGGCASYKWVHPTLPGKMADRAKLQCENEALKLYPVTIVQDVQAGRSRTQGTQCSAQAQGAQCSGGGSQASTASTYSHDINETPRRTRIDTCMRAAGWTQVEVSSR